MIAAVACLGTAAGAFGQTASGTVGGRPQYALAMHGSPALPPDFDHMPYANPNAPKGGRLVMGALGSFDSLNPLIVRGIAVPQIRGYVLESLMARGNDEPFTLYGLLAQSIETDDARSYVSFQIRPEAKFSDGQPVTADDVLFSWDLLRTRGRPNHRLFYNKVSKATAADARTVRFDFAEAGDRELPLIMGLMPILAKHATDPATFEETSLKAPLGSGAYVVSDVRPGVSVTLTRNPDYWGRDLPINKGLWNFDEVRLEFFRDANTAFEAFKRGIYDFRIETEPLRWHSGYDFPAVRTGEVVQETLPNGSPQPSDYLVFNTRRPQFSDVRVRRALTLLYDFEWTNRNYFFNLYQRSASYFPGSELSAYGRAADDRERSLLQPYVKDLPSAFLDGTAKLPVTDGSGRDRTTLRQALALLERAGYRLKNNTMRDIKTGEPLTFEILVTTRDQERIALSFARDLKRAGIVPTIRVVDAVLFDQRRLNYDFDMIENRWDQSLSPGNEQAFYFGSAAAEHPGARNYMGVKSPAVDAMIARIIDTHDREDLVAATRALDRLLMAGCYAIPLFSVPAQWLARWTRVARPQKTALVGYLPETWWQQPVQDK
jgi:peptide/nickel transport system substrate-binding protein